MKKVANWRLLAAFIVDFFELFENSLFLYQSLEDEHCKKTKARQHCPL